MSDIGSSSHPPNPNLPEPLSVWHLATVLPSRDANRLMVWGGWEALGSGWGPRWVAGLRRSASAAEHVARNKRQSTGQTVSVGINDNLGNTGLELRQLRDTIDALRAELEAANARLGAERQRAVAQQEHDRLHARESVDALRDRLETAVAERSAAVQAALAQSADEVTQLKATVETLRRALETARADADQSKESSARAARDEHKQLHEIITALRARLESSNAH